MKEFLRNKIYQVKYKISAIVINTNYIRTISKLFSILEIILIIEYYKKIFNPEGHIVKTRIVT